MAWKIIGINKIFNTKRTSRKTYRTQKDAKKGIQKLKKESYLDGITYKIKKVGRKWNGKSQKKN